MDHDAAHKYLYMLDDVVADLLRLVVPGWVDDLNLAAIENVSTEYLDEDHRRRFGDMVWKVYFRKGALANRHRPYILVLVEFQSTADRDMARRIHEYTDLLLDRLVRNGVMAREGGLPRVLPVVVYNGSERWTAIGGDGGEGHLAPGRRRGRSATWRGCSRSSIDSLTRTRARSRIGPRTIGWRRRSGCSAALRENCSSAC